MPQHLLYETAACAPLVDEWASFQAAESGLSQGGVTVWEASRAMVVVGRNTSLVDQVHEQACVADHVPIVRRMTGGGAVVLAPGCVSYGMVISLLERPEWLDVAASFDAVLGAIVSALALPGLCAEGDSDLALQGRKVSGNAQRRGRRTLLHHGTLLYDFDARLVTRYLKEPARQPDYRARRSHETFLGNIPRSRAEVMDAIRRAWDSHLVPTALTGDVLGGCGPPGSR